MTHSSKNNNLVFAHGETQDLVVVCLSAELSMFLLCGDDGRGGVSPSGDAVILSCAAVLEFSLLTSVTVITPFDDASQQTTKSFEDTHTFSP